MSEIRANAISDAAGTGPITLTKQSAAKAWVNFNGAGTAAIRDSLNVSSLQDNGTGDYTLTYTNVFANSEYSATGGGKGDNTLPPASSSFNNYLQFAITGAGQTICYFGYYTTGGSFLDADQISVASHGDLA